MLNVFHKIICSSYVNMFVAIILMYTSGKEIYETLDNVIIGSHHGVFLFGIVHLLKSLKEFLEGAKELDGEA